MDFSQVQRWMGDGVRGLARSIPGFADRAAAGRYGSRLQDSIVAVHEYGSEEILDNVRSAVAAELTTLPTYLYPYWSIRPAADGGSPGAQVARVELMAVIVEEMLHMGLASNLLNALGGEPNLTERPYLPVFPGKLLRSTARPDGWGPDVDLLPLGAASIAMLKRIELPETAKPHPGPTLGHFYHAHVERRLPPDDDRYRGGRQLAPWDNPGPGRLYSIGSRRDADRAVNEIIHQGEGLSLADHDDGDHELAHYWRFDLVQKLLNARALSPPRDVYGIVPSPAEYVDSYTDRQLESNDVFNRTYSRMLDSLEATLRSDSPDVYPIATGLMSQLQLQATRLRQLGPIPGTNLCAGPTFDYVSA